MAVASTHRTGRIVSLETDARPGRRRGALQAVDGVGRTLAVARFDGPDTSDWVELSLGLGPEQPPIELAGELVHEAAALAAGAGAGRVVVDFDPACELAGRVLAASGLGWRVRPTADVCRAEVTLGATVAADAPRPHGKSLVRSHPKGVTVLPSAEGPSLRSDPRWTPGRARRAERLLDRLIARRASTTAR